MYIQRNLAVKTHFILFYFYIYFKIYLVFMCVFACMYVCMYIICVPGAHGSQKRVSDPLEVKLQSGVREVVSHSVGTRTEPGGSSPRVASTGEPAVQPCESSWNQMLPEHWLGLQLLPLSVPGSYLW